MSVLNRETVTAGLAALISIATFSLICALFETASEVTPITAKELENKALIDANLERQDLAYSRQKDLLTIAIGLFGAVTGYYFGRNPAEARAEKAEEVADVARNDASAAAGAVQQAKDGEAEARRDAKDRTAKARRASADIEAALDQAIAAAEMEAGSPARKTLANDPAAAVAEAQRNATLRALRSARERVKSISNQL